MQIHFKQCVQGLLPQLVSHLVKIPIGLLLCLNEKPSAIISGKNTTLFRDAKAATA